MSKEYEARLDNVMMGNPRSDIEARVIVISGPVETESTKISLQAKKKRLLTVSFDLTSVSEEKKELALQKFW